jgi:Zn-finger nucleic acid-binding protein
MKLALKTRESRKELYGSWRDVVFDLKKATCPGCKKEMKRVKKRGIAVSLDICRTCKGIWLDGGEIRFLQHGQPVRKAARYLFYQMKDLLKKRPLAKRLK